MEASRILCMAGGGRTKLPGHSSGPPSSAPGPRQFWEELSCGLPQQ